MKGGDGHVPGKSAVAGVERKEGTTKTRPPVTTRDASPQTTMKAFRSSSSNPRLFSPLLSKFLKSSQGKEALCHVVTPSEKDDLICLTREVRWRILIGRRVTGYRYLSRGNSFHWLCNMCYFSYIFLFFFFYLKNQSWARCCSVLLFLIATF